MATTDWTGDRIDDSTTPPRFPAIRVNLLHAHGSPTGYLYRYHGCRCVVCRAANTDAQRQRRADDPEKCAEYDRLYRAEHSKERAEYNRRRNAEHPEYTRKYRAEHAKEIAERDRLYRAEHKEELAEAGRKYRVEHREEQAEYRRKHRTEHPGEEAERLRKYQADHKEELAEYKRKYYAEHPEEYAANGRNRRALVRNATGTHTAADVRAQYERQHGKCFWRKVNPDCAVSLKGGYHVDHVVPLILGGSNGPENLVIACPTCNLTKSARHPMDYAGVLC